MKWSQGVLAAAAGVLCTAACDQLAREPVTPGPVVAIAAPTADPAIQAQAGRTYSEFANAMGDRFSPDALGLNAADRARLWRAMADSYSSLTTGGGAEALVFRGCAETGCQDGVAIVAIDTATSAVFVGVVDSGGRDVMLPDDRVEALLRLSSPTRNWDDPAFQTTEAARPDPDAAAP